MAAEEIQRSRAPVQEQTFEDALSFLKEVRTLLLPESCDSFLTLMRDFKSRELNVRDLVPRVKELFGGNPSLLLGFNSFLPPEHRVAVPPLPDPPEPKTSASPSSPTKMHEEDFQKAIVFITRVRERFSSSDDIYNRFIRLLRDYRKGNVTAEDMHTEAASLFEEHPDLLNEFKRYIPQEDFVSKSRKRAVARYSDGGQRKIPAFFSEVKERLRSEQLFGEFLKCLSLYANRVLSKAELVLLVEEILGRHGDLMDMFKKYLSCEETSAEMLEEHEEYLHGHEQSLLDAVDAADARGNSGEYGPSYRRLPRNYPIPRSSGFTYLCRHVLNTKFQSSPAGSEEAETNFTKTPFDEILFSCEDDRTELDVVIAQNLSTIEYLQPKCDLIQKQQPGDTLRIRLDEMRDIHRSAIHRVYGTRWREILEGLKANPSVAIPVALHRLKNKHREWLKARDELNRFWNEVYKRNREKSLEHVCQEFKLKEKKCLNSRGIVNDMKGEPGAWGGAGSGIGVDIGASQGGGATPAAVAGVLNSMNGGQYSGSTMGVVYFHMDTAEIHQEIYALLKLAYGLTNSPNGDRNPIDVIYTLFLRPFLGIPRGMLREKYSSGEDTRPLSVAGICKMERKDDGECANEENEPTTVEGHPVRMDWSTINSTDETEDEGEGTYDTDDDVSLSQAVDENGKSVMVEDDTESKSEPPSPRKGVTDDDLEADLSTLLANTLDVWTSPLCRPIREGVECSADSRGDGTKNYFYGHSHFYVLFRMYQILYYRLQHARKLCRVAANHEMVDGRKNNFLEDHSMFKSSEKLNLPATHDDTLRDILEVPRDVVAEEQRRYAEYQLLLRDLLEGFVDQPLYEKWCSLLMSDQSYVMFTVERLVHTMMREIVQIDSDSGCRKVLGAYAYERYRSRPFCDDSFLRNIWRALGNTMMFKMVCTRPADLWDMQPPPVPMTTDDPSSSEPKVVPIGVPKSRCEISCAVIDAPVYDREQERLEEKANAYVEEFVRTPVEVKSARGKFLFAQRNLCSGDNSLCNNGLEIKMCLTSFRIFFVCGTEDITYRKGLKLLRKEVSNKRMNGFSTWLERRSEEIGAGKNKLVLKKRLREDDDGAHDSDVEPKRKKRVLTRSAKEEEEEEGVEDVFDIPVEDTLGSPL